MILGFVIAKDKTVVVVLLLKALTATQVQRGQGAQHRLLHSVCAQDDATAIS